jgi:putative DNA primase/helicase
MEEIAGKWVIEISEMGATNKQELEQQKSFLSACSTRVRPAYGRHAIDYLRQCVFIGSTNQFEYLKDSTGNRRWWPIDCFVESIDIAKLKEQLDQIWAEAYGSLWAQGCSVFLSKDAEKIAKEVQEDKREIDEWTGIIQSWLHEECPKDRYNSKLGSFEAELETRERVCVPEIWADCLEIKQPPRPADRRRIGGIMDNMPGWKRVSTVRFGIRFGRQKGWVSEVPF